MDETIPAYIVEAATQRGSHIGELLDCMQTMHSRYYYEHRSVLKDQPYPPFDRERMRSLLIERFPHLNPQHPSSTLNRAARERAAYSFDGNYFRTIGEQ